MKTFLLTDALQVKLKTRISNMGAWMGVRWLKNQGFSFEQAHIVMFDRLPRL